MEQPKRPLRVPLCTKCCFCIPLRTGCLIIGYLQLIQPVIGIFLTIIVLTVGVEVIMDENSELQPIRVIVIFIALGILLVSLVIYLIISVVLLVGLHQNKPEHVKIYLLFAVVIHIFLVILCVPALILGYNFGFGEFVEFALSVYCLLIIRSYHIKMTETRERNGTA